MSSDSSVSPQTSIERSRSDVRAAEQPAPGRAGQGKTKGGSKVLSACSLPRDLLDRQTTVEGEGNPVASSLPA